MRYRRADWNVPMPASLLSYWRAWNEPDVGQIRGYLDSGVVVDVEWNDPRDSFVGIDALEHAVRRLRSDHSDYRFFIASEIDHHHGRLRYRWDMVRGHRVLMEGVDVVTLDMDTGLIVRVDGFFGEPTPINAGSSGVSPDLRRR